MIACSSCQSESPNESALRVHLMQVHNLTLKQAADRARLVMRDVERQSRRVAKKKGKA